MRHPAGVSKTSIAGTKNAKPSHHDPDSKSWGTDQEGRRSKIRGSLNVGTCFECSTQHEGNTILFVFERRGLAVLDFLPSGVVPLPFETLCAGRATSILLGLARGSNTTNLGILAFVGAERPGRVVASR